MSQRLNKSCLVVYMFSNSAHIFQWLLAHLTHRKRTRQLGGRGGSKRVVKSFQTLWGSTFSTQCRCFVGSEPFGARPRPSTYHSAWPHVLTSHRLPCKPEKAGEYKHWVCCLFRLLDSKWNRRGFKISPSAGFRCTPSVPGKLPFPFIPFASPFWEPEPRWRKKQNKTKSPYWKDV